MRKLVWHIGDRSSALGILLVETTGDTMCGLSVVLIYYRREPDATPLGVTASAEPR